MIRTLASGLAVAAACVGSAVRADEAEEKAHASLRERGHSIRNYSPSPGQRGVELVRANTKMNHEDLRELARRKSPTDLTLRSLPVRDAGLKELTPLGNLPLLNLSDTQGQTRG